MGKYDEIKKSMLQSADDLETANKNIEVVANDFGRVAEIYRTPNIVISDIDRQFEDATGLKGKDYLFLLTAIALQVARQYLLTNFKTKDMRPDDKEAADKVKKKHNEHSNRMHTYYNPSLEQIITNPVPFDAIQGSKAMKANIGGGFYHRARTLGHDPVLGWIFGTANIATSTVTTNTLQSYHIKTVGKKDSIKKHADTALIFEHTSNKLLHEENKGKLKIGASLFKEAQHLASDVSSKESLPIPVITLYDEKLAKTLADHGLDCANIVTVGKQIAYSELINAIIAMVHTLLYDESVDPEPLLYEARTRKILMYSNIIASASNVIAVAATSVAGVVSENPELVKKGLSYADIGGIIVTAHRIVNDVKFINRIKAEFLEKGWYDAVIGEDYRF